MRIAYVYDVIYPDTIGGIEKRIFELGTRLSRRGHDVHLFGMKYWDGPAVIHRDGMVLHGVCPAMGLYTEGRRSIVQALLYSASLIPPLLRSDADIYDCQSFPYFSVIVSFLITHLKKRPLVVTWHEFWGKYWYSYIGFPGIAGNIIEKIALLCSTDAIAVSVLTASLMKDAGYRSDVTVIPNGMDPGQIESVLPSPDTSDIIFVGRFIPEKHPELVVEAVRLLVSEYPSLRCLMIGDGPDLPSIQDLIKSYDLSDRIECTGFVKDHETVISLMKSSRVFVLPSEREGFGIAALEALASGLSLVTVSHPRNAASVHVIDGAGYLARMDASDIARGIRECLAHPPDTEKAVRYVESHDWEIIAEKTEAFYIHLMVS